ncbi:MAG: DUF2726 domain-containing protein [Tepidisphaeraceae bacterium]|jgi:hypothetical protein
MPQEPIGCLGNLLRFFGTSGTPAGGGPPLAEVRVNKYFVSDAEANFFRVLRAVVGARGHILAQVSLRQLIWFPGNRQSNPGRLTWQNKVAAKSIDFLVCDPGALQPRLAIELDDSTHSRPDRQARDDEVEAILRAAGLPLIHVLASRAYDSRELEVAIRQAMGA